MFVKRKKKSKTFSFKMSNFDSYFSYTKMFIYTNSIQIYCKNVIKIKYSNSNIFIDNYSNLSIQSILSFIVKLFI